MKQFKRWFPIRFSRENGSSSRLRANAFFSIGSARRLFDWIPVRLTTYASFGPHPFRMLLYLEWVLLTISLITPVFDQAIDVSRQGKPLFFLPPLAWAFWTCVMIFGLLGLRLPEGKAGSKALYTAVEFAIVGLAGYLCYWDGVGFAPLLLITAIRSCLLFRKTGRIVIAVVIFIFFIASNGYSWYEFEANDVLTREAEIDIVQEDLASLRKELANLESLPPGSETIQEKQTNLEFLQFQLQTVFFFGLVLVFVLLLINALLAERENRRKLANAHAQLYEYATRIEDQATLQERNRIARDIHDSLGHILTAQSIQLDNGLFFLPSDLQKAQTFFLEGKQLSSEALQELRCSIATLRQDYAQEKSLNTDITQLAHQFSQVTGISIICQIELNRPVPGEVHTAVFRILEEALTNIHKHAQATDVVISLRTEMPNEGRPLLQLMIEDDGLGFLLAQNATGFGLKGMYERATALGGHLEIVSHPGQGCRISGDFPLRFS